MSNFTPIAMRCTQEQFDSIKPKLIGLMIEHISPFSECGYLTNNLWGKEKIISNITYYAKAYVNREVHEEWNEEIFLKACGIEVETTLTEQLEKEEAEVKRLKEAIEEENKPKIGDICKFWDNDKSIFIVGKLERVFKTRIHRYHVHGIPFKNCMKITDENFLKSFDNL